MWSTIPPADAQWEAEYICLRPARTLCNAWRFSVSLLATSRENYWTGLHKNFTTDVSVDKEELIKFWKSSASGFGSRNFLKDSSTLRDRAFFPQLVSYLWKKLIGSPWKFYHWYILGQGSPGSILEVIWIQTPDPDQILLGGGMWSLIALVIQLLKCSKLASENYVSLDVCRTISRYKSKVLSRGLDCNYTIFTTADLLYTKYIRLSFLVTYAT